MNKGIQLALGTALISGFSIFISKILVSSMDPVVFTALKNIFVAAVLSLFVFRSRYIHQIQKLTRPDWVRLILIGIVGGSIPFALFFTGLSMTSAGMGAILHKTLFIWIALLAIPFLREKLSIAQTTSKRDFIPIKDALAASFDRLDELHKHAGGLRGIATGFFDLDNKLAGMQESNLLILAARPGQGKTSLALNIAAHVAVNEGLPVGIFSLEMSKEELVDRLLVS